MLFCLKKIIKETTNWNEETFENTQRVRIELVMEQVPEEIQKQIEEELNCSFDKIKSLVPDTPNPQDTKILYSS